MVTAPGCNMVTTEPATVATLVAELVYEKAPGLLDVGAVMVNVPPLVYVLFEMLKLVMVGVDGVMVNDAVALPAT